VCLLVLLIDSLFIVLNRDGFLHATLTPCLNKQLVFHPSCKKPLFFAYV
jgi:hypothetical protein